VRLTAQLFKHPVALGKKEIRWRNQHPTDMLHWLSNSRVENGNGIGQRTKHLVVQDALVLERVAIN